MVSVTEASWDLPGGSSGTGKVLMRAYTLSKVLFAPWVVMLVGMVAFRVRWQRLWARVVEAIRLERIPTSEILNIDCVKDLP